MVGCVMGRGQQTQVQEGERESIEELVHGHLIDEPKVDIAVQQDNGEVTEVTTVVLRVSDNKYFTHVPNLEDIAQRGLSPGYSLRVLHGGELTEAHYPQVLDAARSRVEGYTRKHARWPVDEFEAYFLGTALGALFGAVAGVLLGAAVSLLPFVGDLAGPGAVIGMIGTPGVVDYIIARHYNGLKDKV